jgi:hypothetical protein
MVLFDLLNLHPSIPLLRRSSGRNKLVINHLGKMFVTSDAATIIKEIEVVHPAAKIFVMASQAQEAEACAHFLPHGLRF